MSSAKKAKPEKGTALLQPLEFIATPTRWNEARLPADECPVTLLCDALEKRIGRPPASWLDLGAGAGAIGEVLRRRYPDAYGVGVELSAVRYLELAGLQAGDRQVYDELYRCDVAELEQHLPSTFDLVIANPAFTLWEVFARAAWKREKSHKLEQRPASGAYDPSVFVLQQVMAERSWPVTALLIPALRFEADRRSKKNHIASRALLLKKRLFGRADIPVRPSFVREFQLADGRIERKCKGTDGTAYAWILWGPAVEERYFWLGGTP